MARLDVTETFHSITFPGHLHTQDSLNYATNFKFRDTDTVIVTYPKSGTTWMQEIITLVLSKGDPTIAQTQPNWARAPWLEQYYCRDVLEVSAGPRIITTHLPYHLLAPALQDSKAKVIYVARNLKDVSVSYYHFHKVANFLPDPGTFSEFLSAFLEGKVHYGSWFDHVKGWTIHSKNIQNFLYITYEEMMQDLRWALEKVSRFLQCPLAEDELVLAQKHCTFNSMKENAMVNYTLIPQEIMDHSKGKFMRKGKHIMAKFLDDKVKVLGCAGRDFTRSISSRSCIVSARVQRSVSLFQHIPNTSSKVGDWKNIFTEEQSCLVDDVYSFQMADSSLLFKWECPRETKTSDNIYIPPSPREIDLLT